MLCRVRLSSLVLVKCFPPRFKTNKDRSLFGTRLKWGSRKTGVWNQRDPCWGDWLHSGGRGGKQERYPVVCCALGSGAALSVLDWWIERRIAHNINSVLLSLSFRVALSHHSSLSLLLSRSPSISPLSLPPPLQVPPFHIGFQKAALMLPESELRVRQRESEVSGSLSFWHLPCVVSRTGPRHFVEEVGEESKKQVEGLRGELGRWRTAANTWNTARWTWESWAPSPKGWPPVSWPHRPRVCWLICPHWSSFLSFLKSLNMFFRC